MDFIIGGYGQGKRQYVKKAYQITQEIMLSGEQEDYEKILCAPCIYDFHLLIRRLMLDHKDYQAYVMKLFENGTCKILISNEIGYGIVPLDAFEREYREAVGRMSCLAVRHAGRVVRVICGLGQIIKQ